MCDMGFVTLLVVPTVSHSVPYTSPYFPPTLCEIKPQCQDVCWQSHMVQLYLPFLHEDNDTQIQTFNTYRQVKT